MFENVNNIFSKYINYKYINSISKTKVRNCVNGIELQHAMLYKFMYTNINSTKDLITSQINISTDKEFTRQAYDNKENNIPISIYKDIYNGLVMYYNDNYASNIKEKIIGIDGTYNNDRKNKAPIAKSN